MCELAELGRWLSIVCTLFVYVCAWGFVLTYIKNCNASERWKMLMVGTFIGAHIAALPVWFVWSWLS